MPQLSTLPRLLTAEQVAEQTGLPRYTVYALARESEIPCVRVRRTVRFPSDALENWIRSGGVPRRAR
jgi:excisionase family DNA binding protein